MNIARPISTATGLAAILVAGPIMLAALAPTPAQATTPLGAEVRLSVTGADGDATLDATDASVAYNPIANQHLIVWQGGPEVGASEIFARLVDAAGTPLGAEFPISDMGPPAVAGFEAQTPAVAYNARRNEYLVVWRGDDDTGPLVDGEFEIFAQRLTAGGAEVGANDRRSPTWGRTATSPTRPRIPPSSTARPAISTWWPGRETTTRARSWMVRRRSSSSA